MPVRKDHPEDLGGRHPSKRSKLSEAVDTTFITDVNLTTEFADDVDIANQTEDEGEVDGDSDEAEEEVEEDIEEETEDDSEEETTEQQVFTSPATRSDSESDHESDEATHSEGWTDQSELEESDVDPLKFYPDESFRLEDFEAKEAIYKFGLKYSSKKRFSTFPLSMLVEPAPKNIDDFNQVHGTTSSTLLLGFPRELKYKIALMSLRGCVVRVTWHHKMKRWTYLTLTPPNRMPAALNAYDKAFQNKAAMLYSKAPFMGHDAHDWFDYVEDTLFVDYKRCGTSDGQV